MAILIWLWILKGCNKYSGTFNDITIISSDIIWLENISIKDLAIGATYITKSQQTLTYLGRLAHNSFERWPRPSFKIQKGHIFFSEGNYTLLKNTSSLSQVIDESCIYNYSELMEKYNNSFAGKEITTLTSKIIPIYNNEIIGSYVYRKISDNSLFNVLLFNFRFIFS